MRERGGEGEEGEDIWQGSFAIKSKKVNNKMQINIAHIALLYTVYIHTLKYMHAHSYLYLKLPVYMCVFIPLVNFQNVK